MTEREIIELYKKDIELFVGTLGIFKGKTIVNTNQSINKQNKKFILSKMREIKAGNFNEDLMSIAIDELIPFLRDHNFDIK